MARNQSPLDEMLGPILGLFNKKPYDHGEGPVVEFWNEPERVGWLMKQGAHIKTWRRRWFVLKGGKIFWFKGDDVSASSQPRGVIEVKSCLSVKGAEDALNKPCAFEISTNMDTMYFIADTDKARTRVLWLYVCVSRTHTLSRAQEKEDWINAIGRAIVRHSASLCEESPNAY